MDKLVAGVSEALARPRSRRWFLGALGAGAVLGSSAGSLALEGLGTAEAAPGCCSGSCSCSSSGACPTWTSR